MQIEYYALPEYQVRGEIEDLSQFGADKFSDFYTPGTWASVKLNGGVYALPMDSGPMAWFYNKDVFDKAGVDPTRVRTWDEFYDAAKKVRATGSYITSDSGDAGFFDWRVRRRSPLVPMDSPSPSTSAMIPRSRLLLISGRR